MHPVLAPLRFRHPVARSSSGRRRSALRISADRVHRTYSSAIFQNAAVAWRVGSKRIPMLARRTVNLPCEAGDQQAMSGPREGLARSHNGHSCALSASRKAPRSVVHIGGYLRTAQEQRSSWSVIRSQGWRAAGSPIIRFRLAQQAPRYAGTDPPVRRTDARWAYGQYLFFMRAVMGGVPWCSGCQAWRGRVVAENLGAAALWECRPAWAAKVAERWRSGGGRRRGDGVVASGEADGYVEAAGGDGGCVHGAAVYRGDR